MTEPTMERDGERLLAFLVPAAEKLLHDEETEEIRPFAAVLATEEEVVPLLPEAPEEETVPDPQAAFEALCDAARARAGADAAVRAAGVAADVHVVREDIDLHTDAIRFFLETRSGEALNVFLPYRENEKGGIETGDSWAVPAEPMLFNDPE